MEIDTKRIEDAIITEVSSKMIGDDELYKRAETAVLERVDRLWESTAETRIRAEIEAVVAQGFDREYQRVDTFGLGKGEKTTIRAELEKLIAGYWNQRVDSKGKPTNSPYGDQPTRAEWLMAQMCAADFKGEMKQHVVNVGGALKDSLRRELHETVNRLLADVFNVRSADDQAASRGDRSLIMPAAATKSPA